MVETKTDVGDRRENVERIVGLFDEISERYDLYSDSVDDIYEARIKGLKIYSVDDIYKAYVKELKNYEIDNRIIQEVIEELESRGPYGVTIPEKCGIGISALTNLSPEKEIYFEINYPWHYLGMYNEGKNIVIRGNVGYNLGDRMKRRGEIVVKGNAGSDVGKDMKGGRIVVGGDAEFFIGTFMRDGEIYIADLNLGKISISVIGGRIYKGVPPNAELVLERTRPNIFQKLRKSRKKN